MLSLSALISGLGLGSMYGLMALGFYVTYAVSGTVNFAQGSSMMLGAVLTYTFSQTLGWPGPLGIALALLGCAAYGLVVAGERVLLTRVSGSGFHTGRWSLPGGGVEHGEHPRRAVVRELAEETGLVAEVGDLLVVDDERIHGTAPSGREEDFHSVAVVYAARVPPAAQPRVVEGEGTTDAVAWVPLADVASGAVPVLDLVTTALAAR